MEPPEVEGLQDYQWMWVWHVLWCSHRLCEPGPLSTQHGAGPGPLRGGTTAFLASTHLTALGGGRWGKGEREKGGERRGEGGIDSCCLCGVLECMLSQVGVFLPPKVTEPVEWAPVVALTFSSPQVDTADPPSLGTLTCALDIGRALLKEQVGGWGSQERVCHL